MQVSTQSKSNRYAYFLVPGKIAFIIVACINSLVIKGLKVINNSMAKGNKVSVPLTVILVDRSQKQSKSTSQLYVKCYQKLFIT